MIPYIDQEIIAALDNAIVPHIHISDIGAFKSCRRRWNWASSLRGNLTPRQYYSPFFVGSAVHYCIEMVQEQDVEISLNEFINAEMHARGIDLTESKSITERSVEDIFEVDLSTSAKDDFMHSIDRDLPLIRGIIQNYQRWVNLPSHNMYAESQFEHLAQEKNFVVGMTDRQGKVCTDFLFAGKIDGLVRHKQTGDLWLMEYKTARTIQERLKMLINDSQATGYIYAMQQLIGEPIAGTIYTILRKKIPESPKVLKSGHLSKDISIDTTPEHFLSCIRQHYGVNATEQFIDQEWSLFLKQLTVKQDPFVSRVAIRRSQATIKQFMLDFVDVAREMINPVTPMYPTEGWHCDRCLFQDPCIGLTQQDSIQPILDNMYMQRPIFLRSNHESVEL